ncbi:hypothetical protein LEM8419_00149 [Neolewinella maritima]|uniref:Serine protease n=1 Tax=Neolewinella maritima TaxID=1383882 RepID=A0ABN8F3X2_9BACT|nr:serine protease [Neolewinella maritima]CAH0998834.1 hypothetical protein LEM8419_00149 [Neolewinella maritima]
MAQQTTYSDNGNGHVAVSSGSSGEQYDDSGTQEFTAQDSGSGAESGDTDTLEALGLEQLQEAGGSSSGDQSGDDSGLEDFDSSDGSYEFSDTEGEDYQEFDGGFDEFDDDGGDSGGGGGEYQSDEGRISIIGDEQKVAEAYIASFPGEDVVQEVVIGRDDRKQVRNTRPFPYRAIVQLSIEAKNGRRYVGTGWLVSPRTVITAGHCVYLHGAGGWAKSIQVTPGMNNTSKPYGSARATAFRSVRGWVKGKSRDYDYGAIILPKSHPLGRRTGTFRYASVPDRIMLRKYVNICGYPGDKGGKTQWYHARRISRITSKRLTYQIDTAGGQSGSPVFYRRGRLRVAVGIHTSGSMSGNAGTRINSSVKANLRRWAREGR